LADVAAWDWDSWAKLEDTPMAEHAHPPSRSYSLDEIRCVRGDWADIERKERKEANIDACLLMAIVWGIILLAISAIKEV